MIGLGIFLFLIFGVLGLVIANELAEESCDLTPDAELSLKTIGFVFGSAVVPLFLVGMIVYGIVCAAMELPSVGRGFRDLFRTVFPRREPPPEIPKAEVVK